MTNPDIGPREALERADEAMLLDVREPHEFAAGHIDGAVGIPVGQLAVRQDELPTDQQIVCVCRSGNRSGMVAAALARAGYDAVNLEGGMLAWVEADLPFVAADGEAGRVIQGVAPVGRGIEPGVVEVVAGEKITLSFRTDRDTHFMIVGDFRVQTEGRVIGD